MTAHIRKWEEYRDARQATYEYRAQSRYKGVADKLFEMGLRDWHTVLDVGAGTCQFGRHLRERGWRGLYSPVDAVVDGVDLERWRPMYAVDFIVSIETLEHLHQWPELLSRMVWASSRGVVLTTPNLEAVDVLKCDPTHVSILHPSELEMEHGFTVERRTWYGVPNDTLLAWRKL